mmetsp:Transcript_20493/g.28747  ORF Transcript_20493/g.28747 Transcript_20493/m.28747 type:complete len:141 (+) Transcript_20493:158-580(+)
MASGAAVNDECIALYDAQLKLGKKLRYIVFKLNDTNTEIVVDKSAPSSASYEDFRKDLPADQCRYAVFDLEFTVDGNPRNKLVFILWAPDNSKIKQKMLYTSSKAEFRKRLVGIGAEIQATDASEIDLETVTEKASRTTQ